MRGPIAFALAIALPKSVKGREALITTTIVIVWSTIAILGGTVGWLIKKLDVELETGKPRPVTLLRPFGHAAAKLFVRPLSVDEYTLAMQKKRKQDTQVPIDLSTINVRRVMACVNDEEEMPPLEEIEAKDRRLHSRPLADLNILDSFEPLYLHSQVSLHQDDFIGPFDVSCPKSDLNVIGVTRRKKGNDQ